MNKVWLFVAPFVFISAINNSKSADYTCKDVGDGWVWFSDHLASSVEYLIVGPAGRRYEAGTGVMLLGSPRGWHAKNSGSLRMTAWGLGALHIRKDDDGPPLKICVGQGALNPINIINREF